MHKRVEPSWAKISTTRLVALSPNPWSRRPTGWMNGISAASLNFNFEQQHPHPPKYKFHLLHGIGCCYRSHFYFHPRRWTTSQPASSQLLNFTATTVVTTSVCVCVCTPNFAFPLLWSKPGRCWFWIEVKLIQTRDYSEAEEEKKKRNSTFGNRKWKQETFSWLWSHTDQHLFSLCAV